MFRKILRRSQPAALALGAALASAAAYSQQVNYSYTFPKAPVSIAVQWNGSTAPTGGDPVFNRAAVLYNDDPAVSILPPNSLVTSIGQTQTLYRARNFTITSPGEYSVTVAGSLTNATAPQGIIYRKSFDPAIPLGAVVQQIPGATANPKAVVVNLPAGDYVFVLTGTYDGAAGPVTATLTHITTQIFATTGSTLPTGAGAQFNRPRANGNLAPNTASSIANYTYKADAFTVPSDGLYQIYSDDTQPSPFPGQLSLYQNSFDPANPLKNCLLVSGPSSVLEPPRGSASLVTTLKAGTPYILVTSNYRNGVSVLDNYTNTVSPVTVPTLDSWTGNTFGGPTFNRPNLDANGATPSKLSNTLATYDAHTFTATTSGPVTISSVCTAPIAWDNYLVVYTGAFDPTQPLTNILAAADGGYNDLTASPVFVASQGEFPSIATLKINVAAGQVYTIVTSGNFSTSSGAYAGSVTSDPVPGAPVVTLTGTLEPGSFDSLFLRPNAGVTPTTPPTAGSSPVQYHADAFTIATDGDYTIVDSTTVPTYWGLYFVLYQGGFDVTHPLTNAIAALGSDDQKAAFTIHLTAGTYVGVSTGFGPLAYGDYALSVQQAVTGATPIVYTDTLVAGTGNIFTRPNVPPTTLSTSTFSKNDYYDAHPFTVKTSGVYNIDAIANPSGLDPFGKWDDFVVLYQGAFDPANPLTNAIASNDTVHLVGTDAGLRNVSLTANTPYTLVTTGSAFYGFGSYQGKVYTGGGEFPTIIPDNNATGVSAVNNVADTFNLTSLNTVTINGLYHIHSGDLVATLSHGGVTVELTDRLLRTTTTTTGSSAYFFGDYTFGPGGSDLGAAATAATATGGNIVIDPSIVYAPYTNGTAGQSSTLTGNFSAFNGQNISGPWTLTIADRNAFSVGQFAGFSFNVTAPSATVTGNIALEGVDNLAAINAAAPLGTFHIAFRIPGTTTELHGYDVTLQTSAGSPNGTFSITVPAGTYDVWIKGAKNLAALNPGVVISGTTVNRAG